MKIPDRASRAALEVPIFLVMVSLSLSSIAYGTSSPKAPQNGKKCALLIASQGGGDEDEPANATEDVFFGRLIGAAAYGLSRKNYDVNILASWRPTTPWSRFLRTIPHVNIDQAKPKNIDDFFERALAGSCEHVEILVGSQGRQCDCDTSAGILGPNDPSDLDTRITQRFRLELPPFCQKEGWYNSSRLAEKIRALDKRGVRTTLVMMPCFSGRIAHSLAGLRNTCVAVQTAGNAPAMACGDHDPDWWTDYTATIELIVMRYYADYIDDLGKTPLFAQSACFQKLTERFRRLAQNCFARTHSWGACLSTVNQAYWLGRDADLSINEPSISSFYLPGEKGTKMPVAQYFSSDHFSRAAEESEMARDPEWRKEGIRPREIEPQAEQGLESLLRGVGGKTFLNDPLVANLKAGLNKAIDKYNNEIRREKNSNAAPTTAQEVSTSQQKIRLLARDIIEKEREIIHVAHERFPDAFDRNGNPCEVPL